MSYLAIGSVTKSLAELLSRKLNKPPLMGAGVTLRVTTLPPDDSRVDQADGVNLFLYRIAESPFASNTDWHGDRANPTRSKRPPLSLSLNYLLTAYAKKGDSTGQDDITAHQILGNALSILHENAVLNDIHDSEFDADLSTNFAVELKNSFEKIIITPSPISMEEFSKIWTGLSKAYRLSVAYEVSLVQIAPLSPARPAGPLAQKTSLGVITIGRPQIGSVSPTSGVVGTEVTIKGSGFMTRGMLTTVSVAGEQFAEADLIKLTANEIIVKIPEKPQRGPKLPLVVSLAGRASAPAVFEVTPWIESLSPLRGVTNIPIAIPFDPGGAPVTATVGTKAATVSVDAANRVVRVIVPDTITTNGPQAVILTRNPGVPQRTNARDYELVPLIQSVTVATVAAPAKTTITVTGRRLAGADVNLKYGTLLIKKGQNVTANEVIVEVPRVLPATKPVSVLVDGHESNLLPPRIIRIEPSEAFPGDQIEIVGAGLSGEVVSIAFDATSFPLGAQPFAGQLTTIVPASIPAGVVAVKVTVNSIASNTANLTVLA
jgi:hypothetical protein